MLEPYTINNLVKFLRFIKYQDANEDLEVLYSKIKNEEDIKDLIKSNRNEDELHKKEEVKELNKKKRRLAFEDIKKEPTKTCESVKFMLMNVEIDAEGITILNVHHLYPKLPIFIVQVSRNIINYDVFFDHDILNIDFTNV